MAKSVVLFVLAAATIGCSTVLAVEHVVLRRDGRELAASGELLEQAADGGLLVQGADGVLWSIQPDELVSHTSDDAQFVPLDSDELSRQLLAELPEGFEAYSTAHYVICHNTSQAYAQWCGALFERLYKSFTNYWTQRGLELHEPRFKLVAVVFADGESYQQHAAPVLGEAASQIIGYYHLQDNRMTMYDLTGVQSLRDKGDRRGSASEINRMLARPEAERTVATIIHEATHQIAFNCGLHSRTADIPLWLSEGIALYFETPDLKSSKGWRNIGAVNRVRLAGFRQYLPRRPADSLESLLADSTRLRDTRTANDAYSEAWALTYFLIRQRPKQFHEYLKLLAEKPALTVDEPETRLQDFRRIFGADLRSIDAEFLKHMGKVK
ncbi:MAG: DUF1570 domain-containing protein [Pirellulales bacterium]